MRKSLLILSVAILAIVSSSAQHKNFSWGIKSGLNVATMVGADIVASAKVDFNAGLAFEIRGAGNFAVAPELVYSGQGYSMSYGGETSYLNTSYINIPIMARYYVWKGLYVELGPQFGFAISVTQKMGSETAKVDSEYYNPLDISIGMGAGYNFGRFFAQTRYNFGLTNLYKNAASTNAVYQIGVGIYF